MKQCFDCGFLWMISLLLMVCGFVCNAQNTGPNIVVIMVDDLGYGDVGAYNSKINFTPNIDQLARQGRKFTDFHSNGPMCSPTRAAFLTGLYQYRFGPRFEGALSAKKKDAGIPPSQMTLADYLKARGYATALYGKWHLGVEEPYLPNNYGFDEFRGLLSGDGDHHSQINRWGMEDWWHNTTRHMEKGYSTDLITRDVVQFIESKKDQPFFVFVSHIAIHFPWQGPDDPVHRGKGQNYENDKWGIIPNEKNVRPHVEAMIKSVDQSVGVIIQTLEDLHLSDNTLVILTSDNGGYDYYYQGNRQFENISEDLDLRGQKTEVFEGGHRVPFIVRWPEKVPAQSQSSATLMTMDLLPTFLQLTPGGLPTDLDSDGSDISQCLWDTSEKVDRLLYWKKDDHWAVRKGQWKYVSVDGESFLFDLSQDWKETKDLKAQYPDLVRELSSAYQQWNQEIQNNRIDE